MNEVAIKETDWENVTEENLEKYGLRQELLEALYKRGFKSLMPVQEQVLSADGRDGDMVVQARTGSGKTLGFLLPLLNTMEKETRRPKVLVLSPTRELAQQIAGEAKWLGAKLGITTAALVGGMSMEGQIRDLRRGAALVIGTPGRTMDHLRRGTFNSDDIETVVLDEGDTMLDMGFREELEGILDSTPSRDKTWLFSATMPQEVAQLSKNYLSDPSWITLCHDEDQHADITHKVYLVPSGKGHEGLVNVLLWENPEMALIFCHTKAGTVETMERLQEEGFSASSLHGDMSQLERNSVMNSFRHGRIPILVATNVAARGLDVQGVSHVIQIGLPDNLETFVHRSGRTGRAGQEGQNIIILTPRDRGRFKGMIRSSSMKVKWTNIPDAKDINKIQRGLREGNLIDGDPASETSQIWAEELLNMLDPKDLVGKLLDAYVKGMPNGYDLTRKLQDELDRRKTRRSFDNDRHSSSRDGGRGKIVSRNKSRFQGTSKSIKLCKGRNDEDWSVGRILAVLCQNLNVDRSEIGNIRMRDRHTEVELGPLASARMQKDGEFKLRKSGLLESNPFKKGDRRRR